MLTFRGTARVFDTEERRRGGRKNRIKAGDILVIRYEGPKGSRHARDAGVTGALQGQGWENMSRC